MMTGKSILNAYGHQLLK